MEEQNQSGTSTVVEKKGLVAGRAMGRKRRYMVGAGKKRYQRYRF